MRDEGGGETGKEVASKRLNWENKKPDSGESGLAVAICGIFQPRRLISAHDHRRQADPCQRARLTVVIVTRAEAQSSTELIIGAI